PQERRWNYSAFTQMQGITYDRGSLTKDDRVDAIAMLVSELNAHLVQDERKAAEIALEKQGREFVQNTMGYSDFNTKTSKNGVQRHLRGIHNRSTQRGRRRR